MTDDKSTETRRGLTRRREAPEGECCFCHEPKEDHPIDKGNNNIVGNYTDHEYIDRYIAHGVDISDHTESECPWCGSTDARVGAYARGELTIDCPDCHTTSRR